VRKNVASQVIAAEMVSVDDGSAFTGTVTVYVTGDGGSQAIGTVGSGVCTHEGNGLHTYQPSQAETNYTHIAFTFVGTGAVPVTIQVYTNVDTQLLDIQSRILDSAGVRASIGMAAADMDAQLDAILAASGGDEVIVAPLVQTDSQRNTPAYIECNQYDVSTLGPFRVETAAGAQFNFANQTDWIIVVWDKDDNELGVVAYADIVFSSSTSDAVMDQYSFAPSAAQVATAGRHTFSIRRPRGVIDSVVWACCVDVWNAKRRVL